MDVPPPTSAPRWLHALASAGRALLYGFGQLVYPNACRLCNEPLAPDAGFFCQACHSGLLSDSQPACPRCAATVGPYVHLDGGCTNCRDARLAFDRAVRLGPYDALWKETVLRLKHHTGEGLAEAVGSLWAVRVAEALRDARPDAVVPVPLHWWHRVRRGYNQSEALARVLAAKLGVPCRPRWLRRSRLTRKQHHFTSPEERRANVRDAFRTRRGDAVRGRHILLVDDVMTTGSTAHEAARPLRAAGAAQLTVAVVARA